MYCWRFTALFHLSLDGSGSSFPILRNPPSSSLQTAFVLKCRRYGKAAQVSVCLCVYRSFAVPLNLVVVSFWGTIFPRPCNTMSPVGSLSSIRNYCIWSSPDLRMSRTGPNALLPSFTLSVGEGVSLHLFCRFSIACVWISLLYCHCKVPSPELSRQIDSILGIIM